MAIRIPAGYRGPPCEDRRSHRGRSSFSAHGSEGLGTRRRLEAVFLVLTIGCTVAGVSGAPGYLAVVGLPPLRYKAEVIPIMALPPMDAEPATSSEAPGAAGAPSPASAASLSQTAPDAHGGAAGGTAEATTPGTAGGSGSTSAVDVLSSGTDGNSTPDRLLTPQSLIPLLVGMTNHVGGRGTSLLLPVTFTPPVPPSRRSSSATYSTQPPPVSTLTP